MTDKETERGSENERNFDSRPNTTIIFSFRFSLPVDGAGQELKQGLEKQFYAKLRISFSDRVKE